jgi:hypothetical protein
MLYEPAGIYRFVSNEVAFSAGVDERKLQQRVPEILPPWCKILGGERSTR